MPDLLLELRSEEIPARMQRKAAGDLRKMVTDGLVEAGLTYEAAREYWTPRRLTLDIRGLTARSKDARDEIKGPPVKAPEAAIQGFLRKAGLADVSQAHVHSDPKKGEFYVAHIVRPGRAAEEIIAALIPQVVRGFPWPKSMRWGAASGPKGVRYGTVTGQGGEALRWVRPLQSIVCTFGPETEEPVVVDFEIDGIASGNITYGHRFHSPGAISVRRFDDYAAKLEAGKVVIDADRRKEIILSDARNLAFANGLDLVEDEALLEEVSGLVEWPVVLMGEFEEDFLEIPAEVIRLTIRANQKCFVTRNSGDSGAAPHPLPDLLPVKDGEKADGRNADAPLSPSSRGEGKGEGQRDLSNRFILTANIEARDGGKEIAHGNGKVVRARLSDALYFWKTDQADLPDLDQLTASAEKFGLDLEKPLDQRMARLDHLGVTFHAKLGTQGQRVERIARLAAELAPIVAGRFSPLEGEMSAKPTEGVTKGSAGGKGTSSAAETTPTAAFGGTSPSRGEETAQLARRAAILAKADLTTEIVGEFPELQGAMGRKYALLQGEHPSVAAAIEEHYKPQGPSDRVPTDPVSIAVALADKLDTLVGFWAIDEKPTGSKDPFALRRAALGVVRILVENGVRLSLSEGICGAIASLLGGLGSRYETLNQFDKKFSDSEIDDATAALLLQDGFLNFLLNDDSTFTAENWSKAIIPGSLRSTFSHVFFIAADSSPVGRTTWSRAFGEANDKGRSYYDSVVTEAHEFFRKRWNVESDLLSFFHDRLKVYLRDQGARHDLIDAVLASGATPSTSPLRGGRDTERSEGGAGGGSAIQQNTPTPSLRADPPLKGEGERRNDDLLDIVRRVEALGNFLETEDGKNLLAGTKRAANILAAEEKKGTAIAATVDPALFNADVEKTLFAAVNQAESHAAQAIQNEDYSAAMRALSGLRAPVDSFFEDVHVNDEDAAVRANRLALLARIRAATGAVADFSKIAG